MITIKWKSSQVAKDIGQIDSDYVFSSLNDAADRLLQNSIPGALNCFVGSNPILFHHTQHEAADVSYFPKSYKFDSYGCFSSSNVAQ